MVVIEEATKGISGIYIEYASRDKDFKTTLELTFADKDETIDLGKKYTAILKSTIRKHSDHGFVGYREAFKLSKEINNLLADVENMLRKGNFRNAFDVLTVILKEMMDVVSYCYDSSGNIGDVLSETISLISNTADDARFL